MIGVALWAGVAWAVRPTEGGAYSFSGDDVIATWDDPTGVIRVTYSVSGPNVVRSGDDDGDGVPDFAEDVGTTAAAVLGFYESLGFRRPVSEADMGLGDLGGSGAFDFYLVDFGGAADGMFGVDACATDPYHCSGYMVMENDFSGYGYSSIDYAIGVLTSHELFHAVQAAYDGGQESWLSEGTATWAEQQWDPPSDDFLAFCDAYLADVGRSIDEPPTGPVPAWSYGTALFWDFLTTRHGAPVLVDLWERLEAPKSSPADPLAALSAAIEDQGSTLGDDWRDFAEWNLATGDRSGVVAGYAYADELSGVPAEREGASVDDDERFYPLAATYYRLDHAGGPMYVGVSAPSPGLWLYVHPVADGGADGPVDAPVDAWEAVDGGVYAVADGVDLPAGGYWLVGTNAQIADESTHVDLCWGDEAAARLCVPSGDTGDTGAPVDSGTPPVDSAAPDDTAAPADTGEAAKGCGCASPGGSPVGAASLVVAGLVVRRRRRQPARAR